MKICKNFGRRMVWVHFGYAKFFFKTLDGVMERGDKILRNGIFAISTGQKLTEILQVNFFYFSAIYAKNVRSGRGRLKIFCGRYRVKGMFLGIMFCTPYPYLLLITLNRNMIEQ